MKREKVLNKAQECLIRYSFSTSKYYNELKKNYDEYKNSDTLDAVTANLYEKQILKLIRYVEDKENFYYTLITMIIMIMCIVALAAFISVNIFKDKDDVNVVIEKANTEVDLRVKENDFDFTFGYTDIDHYMDMDPISLELMAISKDNYNIFYDIYISSINTSANLEDIKYSVTVNDETHVYNLKDSTNVLESILLYTGNMRLNEYQKVFIRFFTFNKNADTSTLDLSFKYDGYLE
jgi:FlaG/FlaF family flagellin (archaellin)